ncbi:MAG: hypothetical protein AB1705_09915 [Verrucomicrobiota bacterium]
MKPTKQIATEIIQFLWDKGVGLGFHPDSDAAEYVNETGQPLLDDEEAATINAKIRLVFKRAEREHLADPYALFTTAAAEHVAALIRKHRPLTSGDRQLVADGNLVLLHQALAEAQRATEAKLAAAGLPAELRALMNDGRLALLHFDDDGTIVFAVPHKETTYSDVELHWHPEDQTGERFTVFEEHYHDREHYSPAGRDYLDVGGDTVNDLIAWLED